jgi:ABC-2 type transport system ATP-binding protein
MAELPLVVEGAVKKFGGVTALAGTSFELRPGELLGLLGPNGAGKTTVIRAIAGRVKLDGGGIRLFGRRLTPPDPRPEIGVVPQELAVYPKLTATENLEVFGRLNGVSRAALRDRVQWALEWSDLKDRAREPVLGFSGGMKRRLNIACSLVHQPTVVLLDEPTVGVDPQSRERIYEMLADLQKSGVSIVLTTHHLEEAERRCERIVIIDHGKAVASGTVHELLGKHAGASRAVTVLFADNRPSIRVPVVDIGPDLAGLLTQLSGAGARISDVQLESRSLQDVFIALTGRELRD